MRKGKKSRLRDRGRESALSREAETALARRKGSVKLNSGKRAAIAIALFLIVLVFVLISSFAAAMNTMVSEVVSSSSKSGSRFPAVAVGQNDPYVVHVVWEDDTEMNVSGFSDEIKNGPDKTIFYLSKNRTEWSQRQFEGAQYLGGLQDVNNDSMISNENADITVDYNNITHVVWQALTKPETLTADAGTLFLAHFDNPDSFGADNAFGQATTLEATGVTSSYNSIHNKSVYIDGADVLTYNAENNINMTKGTIEFWYNPQHWSRSASIYHLFNAWNETNTDLQIYYYDLSPSYIEVQLKYNSSYTFNMKYHPKYELKNNEWHHIAFAYDFSAGDCRLYFDGNLEAVNSSCAGTSFTPSNFSVGLQYGIRAVSDWRARGMIDELRLSQSVRTASEIRADAGQWDIFHRSLNGTTWSSITAITSDDSNNSYFPEIDVDRNNTLKMVWNSFHNSTFTIVNYRQKGSSGSWSAAETVSSGSRTYFPDIAVDTHNNSHVVWQEIDASAGNFSNFSMIEYRKRNMSQWAPIENVSNRTPEIWGLLPQFAASQFVFSAPRVAVGGDNTTHIVWSTQSGFPDNNLLFYLSFDDMTGNVTFANGSTEGHNGGAYIFTESTVSTNALMYNGHSAYFNASSYVNYTSSANINPNYGTVMMWVKPNWDPGSVEPGRLNSIFTYYSSNASLTDKNEYLALYIKQCTDNSAQCNNDATSSILYFHIFDNKTVDNLLLYNVTSWDIDTWYHIAVAWNLSAGNNQTKLFIDGDSAEPAFYPNNNSIIYFNDTPTEIILGNVFNESTANYPDCFNGSIDEVMVFERVLEEGEVDAARKKDLDIVYRKKNDTGWQDYELASPSSHHMSVMPSIASKDNYAYVVWEFSEGSYAYLSKNYYYGAMYKTAMNTRNSTSWGGLETLNDESRKESFAPDIAAVRPGRIDVVWEDAIRVSENAINVFYREFTNTTLPAVTMIYPLGGEVLTSNFNTQASSSDADVSNISFYYTSDDGISGNLICTATSAPFSCEWKIGSSAEDIYKVKAIATSDDGGKNWSISNYIYLNSSASVNFYIYNSTGNAKGNHKIYEKGWKEDNASGRPNLTDPHSLGTNVTSTARANVSMPDNQRYKTSMDLGCGTYNQTNAIIFKFYIDEAAADISNIRFQWNGYGYTKRGYLTNMSVWNFTASRWEHLDYHDFTDDEDADLLYSMKEGFSDVMDTENNSIYIMVETLDYASTSCSAGGGLWFCPLYLSWNGTGYAFETEGILGIFSRHAEVPTYDRLYSARPENGTVRLVIAEVVEETTRMDSAELIAVDHSRDAEVLLDSGGKPHTIKNPKKVLCRDSLGNDCTALVESADEKPSGARSSLENGLVASRSIPDPLLEDGPEGSYWVSNLSALGLKDYGKKEKMASTRDYIELTLPAAADTDDADDNSDNNSDGGYGSGTAKLVMGISDTGLLSESEANLFEMAADTLPQLYSALENPYTGKLSGSGIMESGGIKIQIMDENNKWVDYPGRFENAIAGSYRTLLFPLNRSLIRGGRIRVNMMVYAYMIDYIAVDYSEDEKVHVSASKPDIKSLQDDDDERLELGEGDFAEIIFTDPARDAVSGSSDIERTYFLKTEGYYHPGEKKGMQIKSMDNGKTAGTMPGKVLGILDAAAEFADVKNGTVYLRMMYDQPYAERYMIGYYLKEKSGGRGRKIGSKSVKRHNSLYTDYFRIAVGGCIIPVDNLEIWSNTTFCADSTFTVYDADSNGRVVQIMADNVTLDCKRSVLDSGGSDTAQMNEKAGTGIGIDWADNVIVRNCNVSRYGVGIGANGSKNVLFYNNTLKRNYIGMGAENSNNSVFRENIAIGSYYVGFGLTSDSTNNTLVNNSAINTTLLAYALEGADNTTMEFNIANGSVNQGFLHLAAIGLTKGAYYNTIRNNTIYGIGLGIGMVDVGKFLGQPSYGVSGKYNNFSSNTISNMLINGIGILYPYDEDYYNYFDQNNIVNGERIYYYFDVHGTPESYVQINSLNLTAANTTMFIGKLSLVNCSYINITNSNVSGNFYGMLIFDSNNILISNNRATNNGEVPLLKFATSGTIVGAGYVIINSNDINITSNNATDNFYGYYASNSKNITFRNNTAQSSSWSGYFLNNTNLSTMINNSARLSDVAGYTIAYSTLNTLINNTAADSAQIGSGDAKSERGKGLYFAYAFNNTVTNNRASNCTYGYYMYAANETFANNTAINNTMAGVVYSNCLAGFIINETGNIVENNTGSGYMFSVCNKTIVKNLNTTKNNRTGFEIYHSSYLTMSNLWSKNSNMGFFFNESQNCTLVNSQTINSTSHEIYFYESRDNNIVDSTVTNNVSGFDVYSTTNSWNYLVNTSVNESSLSDASNSNVSLRWYLEFHVQDNETVPVAGASIWLNDTVGNNYTGITDSNAMVRMNLTEYVVGGGSTTYYENYTWNVTKAGYMSNVSSINMSQNRNVSVTINLLGGIADISPPTTPTVFDGYDYVDYDWTDNSTTLLASWNNASDRHLIFYGYRILENGTCLAGSCAPTELGQATQAIISGLNLREGYNYSIGIRARDSMYYYATFVYSDGIIVDLTPPNVSVNSSTHPNSSQWYSNPNVTFTFFGNDSLSGISGYSYVLDQNSGTGPDLVEDEKDETTLQAMKNTGQSKFLRANSTGPAFVALSQINSGISVGDNVTVSVALTEDIADTRDDMALKAYLLPGSANINNYDLEWAAMSNIETKEIDISHRSITDVERYTFNFIATSASSGSFYVAVASIIQDDNNTRNITIAGTTTDIDNTTQSFICEEGAVCTNTTTTFDYAIEVKRKENLALWSKTYHDLANGEHWFHVRAKDNAGNWGEAAHFNVSIDSINGTPRYTRVKPIGYIVTASPLLVVDTNEYTTCYYNTTNITYTAMTSYDGIYHETELSGLAEGAYTYSFNCTDRAGNSAYNSTTFTFDLDAAPDEVSIFKMGNYTAGKTIEVKVNVTKEDYGIGELADYFSVNLTNSSDEMYVVSHSVKDNGNGIYTVTFTAPLKAGLYDVTISVRGISDKEEDVTISSYSLTVRYSSGDLSKLNTKTKMAYSIVGTAYIIGVAGEAPTATTSGTTTSQIQIAGPAINDDLYLFITKMTSEPGDVAKYIDSGTFLDLRNPAFGYPTAQDEHVLSAMLEYADISIVGSNKVQEGRYTLLIKNEGLNETTGKTKVSISII